MSAAPDPAPLPPKPRRRWLPRLRFSLRTLVILVLLTCSAGGLWWRWDSWVIDKNFVSPLGSGRTGPHLETGARLSKDKHWLCCRFMDVGWCMYDAHTGDLKWTWHAPSDEEFTHIGSSGPGITFTQDGQYVALEKTGGNVCLLRVSDGSPVEWNGPIQPEWLTNRVWNPRSGVGCSFSPDGKRRVVRAENGWAIEDCATNQIMIPLPGGGEPRGSAFSADNSRIATVSYGGGVCIHNSEDGRLLMHFPTCLMGRSVEFSDDGDTLLVTGRKWRVWILNRRRPEYRWGVAWLPEFWLTALFAGALIWSVWKDRKIRTVQ